MPSIFLAILLISLAGQAPFASNANAQDDSQSPSTTSNFTATPYFDATLGAINPPPPHDRKLQATYFSINLFLDSILKRAENNLCESIPAIKEFLKNKPQLSQVITRIYADSQRSSLREYISQNVPILGISVNKRWESDPHVSEYFCSIGQDDTAPYERKIVPCELQCAISKMNFPAHGEQTIIPASSVTSSTPQANKFYIAPTVNESEPAFDANGTLRNNRLDGKPYDTNGALREI